MLDELDEERDMHSIQEAKEEEDDEPYQIGRGMRTGLSIEDDEPEDDFNFRAHTGAVTHGDREDIDDMAIAGTQTKIYYQNEEPDHKTLNDDLHEIEDDYEDQYNDDDEEEEEKVEPDMTIPVDSPNIPTQFSIHNSGTKFGVEKPGIASPGPASYEREHIQTTFSVKEVAQDFNHKPSIDEISENEPTEDRK